ncbi:hypothetical protein HIM_07096 [Hirsutella minnesotensis 3608]|uniref:Gluconokinase n=1 Tax=Hirsutella minnesotensis 3608 TaxID=1043627 RepID=A0A0F7ZND1_9HYPO|nr:hypothetical protein HIM_07096 [Hirsutella minnesotensis 3608]
MLSYDNAMTVNGQEVSGGSSMTASSRTSPATNSAVHTNGRARNHHHIWLVTGPAGCGKTTVAEHLAKALNMPYVEGDSYHTPANVERMRSGIPLTDADRWDWLTALREESTRQIKKGHSGVVVTCSALKRKYRDVIRVAAYFNHDILVHFIFLNAPAEVLLQRVMSRQGHYMGPGMVQSQFDILERPAEDEKDVISIDVSRSIDEVKKDALARVTNMTFGDRD